MQKVIDDCDFKTVLDVGSGEGLHANHFTQNLKAVTTIDFGGSDYFKNSCGENACIVDDFNRYEFKSEFDLVWCSHVLEHQLNVNIFLKKIFSLITPGGYLAITVPPSRATIVGGHLTNWNAGLLLYNLVLAGFDCREAKILKYGYNISVIVRKNIEPVDISTLVFDAGDIRRIKCFLPKLRMFSNDVDDPFDGDIWVHNW